jgi:hypothetical protein
MGYYGYYPVLFQPTSAGPPPSTTLLEGFESFTSGLPNSLDWSASSPTVSQSSSHVTQGSFSCRLQFADGSSSGLYIENGTPGILGSGTGVDLSGYDTLYLDFTVTAMGAGGQFAIEVYDNDYNFSAADSTSLGFTGSDTFTIDLTTLSPRNNASVYIYYDAFGSALDVYIDNFRAE